MMSKSRPNQRSRQRIASIGLYATLLASPCAAAAQTPCKPSPELDQAVLQHPGSETYNALGVYFARARNFSCAIPAFKKSLETNPSSWEPHYNLALAMRETGDLKGARQELERCVTDNPRAAKARIAYGATLHDLGELELAVVQYKEALKVEPNSPDALYNLGQILTAQNSFDAAIYYLRRGLKADASDPSLQLALGIALSKNDETREAIQTLKALVAGHPQFAPGHFNLATALAQDRQYTEAAREYGEALKLEADNDEARISQANALITMGAYAQAAPLVEAYLKRRPNDEVGYFEQAQIDRGLENYAKSEAELNRAFELKPEGDYGLNFQLGAVQEKLGKFEAAKTHLEAALKLDPHAEEARFHLAGVLRKLHDDTAAARELQTFNDMKSQGMQNSRAGVLNNQGIQLLSQGDARGAAAAFEESVTLNPHDAKQFYNLAVALNKVGDIPGEKKALNRALELDPNFYKSHNLLGLLLLGQGDTAAAKVEFQTALKIRPRFAEAENNLGVVEGQQGENGDAEKLLGRAVEDDPEYAQAYVNLALVLAAEEKYASGEHAIREALRLTPNDPHALTALGTLQNKLNHKAESIQTFEQIVTLQPDSAEAHLNLGIALADGLNPASALTEFSTAVRLAPRATSTHYNKGRILLDLNQDAEARAELELAASFATDPADASAALYLEAMAEKRHQNLERSAQLLSESIRRDPSNADARFLFGQILSQQGKTSAACEQWEKAVEIEPEDARALNELSSRLRSTQPEKAQRYGDLLAALERHRGINNGPMRLERLALDAANAHALPDALKLLAEALKSCGECGAQASIRRDLGLIYLQSGNAENGERELRRALDVAPGDPRTIEALELVKSAQKQAVARR